MHFIGDEQNEGILRIMCHCIIDSFYVQSQFRKEGNYPTKGETVAISRIYTIVISLNATSIAIK